MRRIAIMKWKSMLLVTAVALVAFLSPKLSNASNQFKIAHLKEQGQDMVIVPLDNSFGYKSSQQQNQIKNALQACAFSARLKGIVVPVWEQNNSFYFMAPQPWHPFFKGLSMQVVMQNVNKKLTCR
jgi:hypothetical protein